MSFERPEAKSMEAPQEITDYVKWWHETYGKEVTAEEFKQLIGFAQSLAKKDSEFKTLLGEKLARDFIDNEEGLEDKDRRRMALLDSLSTYAEKFGLSAD
jgi:hypothetical protein